MIPWFLKVGIYKTYSPTVTAYDVFRYLTQLITVDIDEGVRGGVHRQIYQPSGTVNYGQLS